MQYCPKVSIIIPVYNGSNYLSEAIDAALAQTYNNCEVLVVNDGSTDGGDSEKIALSYGEKIRYFYKENGGVSSALNYAFSKMQGEWFSWLSHDDLYYHQKIEKQVEFLNQLLEKNPSVNLKRITVRTATESIDRDGKVIRRPSYRKVPEWEKPIDTIINNVYTYRLSGCSFLLPAACIADVGGFREDIRTVSDVEYWYRLLFAGYEFYCLSDQILVKNRSHGKQVGKIKVSLFEEELNRLHMDIADKLIASQYSSPAILKKYYLGLVSRKMEIAANYVKEKYLSEKGSKIDSGIMISVSTLFFYVKGTIRNIARNIYRRIKVK